MDDKESVNCPEGMEEETGTASDNQTGDIFYDRETTNQNSDEVADKKDEVSEKEDDKKISGEKYKKRRKRITLVLKLALLTLLFVGGALIVIPLAQSLGDGDAIALGKMFETMDWEFATYSIACFLILVLIGAIRLCYITYVTSKKFLPIASARIFMLGKFYDFVTPLATGGQPFEIYELNKKGIPGGVATAIPLIRYFVQMFVLAPIAVILFIINNKSLAGVESSLATVISVSAYIGIAVFLALPLFLIMVSIAPKFGRKIARGVIKIGKKLKLIKDYDKAILRAEKIITDFKSSLKYVATNPLHLIVIVFTTLIEIAATYAIPFFLCVALGDVLPTWALFYQTFTLGIYAFFAVSFMPTPGNAGFSESVFAIIFTGVALGKNVIFWLVIFWRVLTYYIFILIGLIIILVDNMRKRIGVRKKDRKV